MIRLAYALACYLATLATVVWLIVWVSGLAGATAIDAGPATSTAAALAIDVALLGLFAVQHSVMARPAFKRAWTQIVPPSVERATYLLATCLVLAAIFVLWRPIPRVLWDVTGPGSLVLWVVHGLGWAIALGSTFEIDHAHLFGLRQAWDGYRGRPLQEPAFRTVLLYKLVRHPLMLGFAIAFWATPRMTLGHLVFAGGSTAYILLGIALEERGLSRVLGPEYARYRARVPMLLPLPRRRPPA